MLCQGVGLEVADDGRSVGGAPELVADDVDDGGARGDEGIKFLQDVHVLLMEVLLRFYIAICRCKIVAKPLSEFAELFRDAGDEEALWGHGGL